MALEAQSAVLFYVFVKIGPFVARSNFAEHLYLA